MISPPIDFAQITLALLAGGEGSRMGGPKSLLRIGNEPIVSFLHHQWNWPGPTMLVTAPGKQKPPGADLFLLEAVDPVAGEGPLRGILTALESLQTEMMLVVTVDMPGIRAEQLKMLSLTLHQNRAWRGIMFRRRQGAEERIEPLPAAFRADAAIAIRQRLGRERRSVHSLLDGREFVAIESPSDWGEQTWTNLNTPADLQEFLTKQNDSV